MLTMLTGAKYTSIVLSKRLYGCFFSFHYYFLYSIHLHSYLLHLYGHFLYSVRRHAIRPALPSNQASCVPARIVYTVYRAQNGL